MPEDVSVSLRPQETLALPALIHTSATAQAEEATIRAAGRPALRPQETLWGRYKTHKGGVAGLIVVFSLTGVACLAPVLAPSDPFSLGDSALSAPSSLHLMGTDHLGRDILSAVLWGLRIRSWSACVPPSSPWCWACASVAQPGTSGPGSTTS